MERIVVGIDGRANSRRALAWAAGEARDRDAELVIVHAWMLPAAAHGSLISPNFNIEGTKKSYRDAARGTVAAMLRGVDLDGVRHEVRIIEGLPGPALVDSSSHDGPGRCSSCRRARTVASPVRSSGRWPDNRRAVPRRRPAGRPSRVAHRPAAAPAFAVPRPAVGRCHRRPRRRNRL